MYTFESLMDALKFELWVHDGRVPQTPTEDDASVCHLLYNPRTGKFSPATGGDDAQDQASAR